MTTRFDPQRPRVFSLAIAANWDRLGDIPMWGRFLAAFAAVGQIIVADMLTGIFFLLLASGVVDYYLGRLCAKRTNKYDPLADKAGQVVKLGAVAILFLIRGLEAWAARYEFVETNGAIATALAVGLFVLDLRSIEHHRLFLGGRAIPGLSQVLSWAEALERRLLPPVPAATTSPASHEPVGPAPDVGGS